MRSHRVARYNKVIGSKLLNTTSHFRYGFIHGNDPGSRKNGRRKSSEEKQHDDPNTNNICKPNHGNFNRFH